MSSAPLIVRVVGNALAPKIGKAHYHAQLGLQDKGRAIKGLVVRQIGSMALIYDLLEWSLDKCKVHDRSEVDSCRDPKV